MKIIQGALKGMIFLYFLILVLLSVPGWIGIQTYAVTSGSMKPVLPVGTQIWLKEETDIRVEDIITFRVGESVVTHRVVEVLDKNQGYVTKGDANEERDLKITEKSQVLGRVCVSIPYLGFAAMALETVMGKVFAVIFILWLMCLEAVTEEIQKMRMEKGAVCRG